MRLIARGKTALRDLKALFEKVDINKDGKLSREEIAALFETQGLEIPEDEMKQLFNSFDSDNNGVIEVEEFTQHLKFPCRESYNLILEETWRKLCSGTDVPVLYIDDVKKFARVSNHHDFDEFAHACTTSGNEMQKTKFMEYYSWINWEGEDDLQEFLNN